MTGGEAFQVMALVFCSLMTIYSIVRGHPVFAVITMAFVSAVAAFLVALPG